MTDREPHFCSLCGAKSPSVGLCVMHLQSQHRGNGHAIPASAWDDYELSEDDILDIGQQAAQIEVHNSELRFVAKLAGMIKRAAFWKGDQ